MKRLASSQTRQAQPKQAQAKPARTKPSTKLASWLPLFQRLLARISQLPRVETFAGRGSVKLRRTDQPRKPVGAITIKKEGLVVSLCLPVGALIRSPRLLALAKRRRDGVSHTVLITQASEIDAELLNWIKAARHRARISRRQST